MEYGHGELGWVTTKLLDILVDPSERFSFWEEFSARNDTTEDMWTDDLGVLCSQPLMP